MGGWVGCTVEAIKESCLDVGLGAATLRLMIREIFLSSVGSL